MQLPKNLTINPIILSDILFRKSERISLFLSLEQPKRIEALRSLTPHVRRDVLMRIPLEDLVHILEAVDPDKATEYLRLLTPHRREKALVQLGEEVKSSLSTLLEFDPETAAGLMTLDYVQADVSENVASVAEKFKQHEKITGRPPAIVVMKEGKLAGFLPGHELGFARPTERIDKYVKRLPHISYAAKHEDVKHLFRAHPHNKVAVMNDSGAVLGIIYSDDVLKLMQEQDSGSLYDFAGVNAEESVTDPVRRKVKMRYKWLVINLATAFMAAFTVGQFEDILTQFVLLAVYMPIVAGMGGNAATQTLAVMVRGIALKQVSLKTAMHTLKNEVGAGLMNGIINGILVALVVLVINHDIKIALVLGLAMIINLLVAGLFGTMVPLIMQRLGKDPATSATIFITTATDVLGFLAFLGLATIILA